MKIQNSLRIALNIIIHSKLRSWLTILGIVIGIAAVVSIMSLGQGAQKSLEANLNTLSADVITISKGFSRAAGVGASFGGEMSGVPFSIGSSTVAKNLTAKDITMMKSVSNVKYIMGTISGSSSMTYLDKSTQVSIAGVDPSIWKYFETTELASGRYLVLGDTNSIVVGSRVANSTFLGLVINRQVSIDGKTFNVVGILKESGGSEDGSVFMPIDLAVDVLDSKGTGIFDRISVKISDVSLTDQTINDLTAKMMLSHSTLQSSKKDFTVTSPRAIQERISSSLGTMSLFLSAIAGVSLLVGAVGITNTMFTSVLERTREIGILKATGAKDRDILAIFLMNAGTIGLIGGVLGVILGILLSGFLGQAIGGGMTTPGRFSLASTYVSFQTIVIVFALSMVIGLVAGAVPAYRASKMNPVEALRYE